MTLPTKRTLLVCGSRLWCNRRSIRMRLSTFNPETVRVIHGAAHGADTIAAEEATALGFEVQAFPADWKTHGRKAGILRNLEMLREADEVLAFWDQESPGTSHTIEEARRRGFGKDSCLWIVTPRTVPDWNEQGTCSCERCVTRRTVGEDIGPCVVARKS